MLKNVSQNIRLHTYFNEHNYILSTNRSEFYLYRAGTLRSIGGNRNSPAYKKCNTFPLSNELILPQDNYKDNIAPLYRISMQMVMQ